MRDGANGRRPPCDEKHEPGDWRSHRVGDPRPCRICHLDAFMRDCNDRPCHKVCADAEQASPTPAPAGSRGMENT